MMEVFFMTKGVKMTVPAASRIYSATAKNGNGSVGKGTFAAHAMSVAMSPTRSLATSKGVITAAKGKK